MLGREPNISVILHNVIQTAARLKRFFSILFLYILVNPVFSQIDKEFWFVAPEISSGHGDQPVLMRISTMEETADITLRMPADLSFTPITQQILPNTTFSIDLTPWLAAIENNPPDMVLNRGLLLTSSKNVTAYYECAHTNNPVIFSMKGKNSLGTEFYIVSQNNYYNQVGKESFEIVATEDNTTVWITPSDTISGHKAGVPYSITLMKGQTYSARAVITTAPRTLAGSHITSDKPIAVTWQDDSIRQGSAYDIVGDQIIPVNILGWEYIVIKGYAFTSPSPNNEHVYIMAVADSTILRMDGNSTPVDTLMAGEFYNHLIALTDTTAYIKATKPVHVLHISGFGNEFGGAILPQDSCTGSRQMGFNRTNNNTFALLLLTRNGNQDSFYLNGSNSIITAADFRPVPGTAGSWVYARRQMTTGEVPTGGNLINNTHGKFHLGILHKTGSSAEYGYFSDFSSLYLGADASICPGDSMVLDGGANMTSYAWKQVIGGVWTLIDTNRFYTIHDTGYYACQVNGDFCTLMDTIQVSYYPNATVNIGADRTICEGTTTTIDAGSFVTYQWSNGYNGPSLTTGQGGEIWVKVTNNNGCIAHDTLILHIDSLPQAGHAIAGPDTVCQGQAGLLYSIDSLHFATTYQWNLPPGAAGFSDTSVITIGYPIPAASGTMTVRGYNHCGFGPDTTLQVTVKPLPLAAATIKGTPVVCQGDTGVIYSTDAIPFATSYAWTLPAGATILRGAGNDTIAVSYSPGALSGDIWVHGQNECGDGDSVSYAVTANLFPVPAGVISGLVTVCQGETGVTYFIPSITGADTYIWSVPPGALIRNGDSTTSVTLDFDSTATSGAVTVFGRSYDCGDGIAFSLPITVNPLPSPAGPLLGATPVCQGQFAVAYITDPIANATSYIWTHPSGSVITAGAGNHQIILDFATTAVSGPVTVRGNNVQCGMGRRSVLQVVVDPLPGAAGPITGPSPVCQAANAVGYTTSVIPYATSYQWTYTGTGATIVNTGATALTDFSSTATSGTFSVTGQNACGDGPVSGAYPVVVNPIPIVSLNICNPITTRDAQPFLLKGGIPVGGFFSGPGVTGSLFTPSAVPAGIDTAAVNYQYSNQYSCVSSAFQKIVVLPGQPFACGGSLTDVRDNKTYPTVQIGSQCWMAANLDFGLAVPSSVVQQENCINEKYCYNDNPMNCSMAGGLYQWDELMQYETSSGRQGLCPPAWHIPSEAEWNQLFSFYISSGFAGSPLKSTGYSGFDALLDGVRFNNQVYDFTGFAGFIWSSTATGSSKAWAHGMNSYNPSVSFYPALRSHAFFVRCVKE
jgi:uncharacterized protein (TIGR02145 family)